MKSEEVIQLFNQLRYEQDVRNPPDNRRHGQFKAGWQDATIRGKGYADTTLASLTWRNLGYRFGSLVGAKPEDEINQAYDVLASLYHSKYQAAPIRPNDGPTNISPVAVRELLARQENKFERTNTFDPTNQEDARERLVAEIVRRRGQPVFRRKLLMLYEGRCAISGCEVEATLEAAHIVPYRGPETNHPANGLLLRADLHMLFDLGLIAVDTATMTVIIAPELEGTWYAQYGGIALQLPQTSYSQPSREALDMHRKAAGLTTPCT